MLVGYIFLLIFTMYSTAPPNEIIPQLWHHIAIVLNKRVISTIRILA